MGNIIELCTPSKRGGAPLFLLDHDYKHDLQYNRGIEVPQTAFDHWASVGMNADAILYQWSGQSHLTIGTITYQERRDMERILELADRYRTRDYGRCRLALVEWLRQEGVKPEEIVFSGGNTL